MLQKLPSYETEHLWSEVGYLGDLTTLLSCLVQHGGNPGNPRNPGINGNWNSGNKVENKKRSLDIPDSGRVHHIESICTTVGRKNKK